MYSGVMMLPTMSEIVSFRNRKVFSWSEARFLINLSWFKSSGLNSMMTSGPSVESLLLSMRAYDSPPKSLEL